jgi:zinc protease
MSSDPIASPAAAEGAGLDPFRTVLSNGAVVIAKHTRTMSAVTINIAIRSGSTCDPPGHPGAMFLLSRVIDRGTANRSAGDIAEALDNRGITLNVSVARHLFSLSCTCLSEDVDEVFSLMSDVVKSPSIPNDELAVRKAEAMTVLRQDEDNPAVRAVESLMELLYPAHPYGRRIKGTVDVIERLTRDRLLALHAEWFAPELLSVVIVGDVPVEHATDLAERSFGGWRVPAPPAVPLPPAPRGDHRQRAVISMMNKAQADIAYGLTAIARSDPAYYAASVMNNILGQYSMGGRLGDSIRERQGMAYYAFSSLDANVSAGPFIVRAGVSPDNVARAISSIDAEIERFVRDGATAGELRESQQFLVGSMPRALETNAAIAVFLQTAELFGLGLDYDRRLPGYLRAITIDEVRAAAARLLDPGRATVVIAGPYREQ